MFTEHNLTLKNATPKTMKLAGAIVAVLATTVFAQASGEILDIKQIGKPRLAKTFGDIDGGVLKPDTLAIKVLQKAEAPNDNGRSKESSAKLRLEKRAEKIRKIREDVPKN